MKRFVALIAIVALFAFAGPVLAAGHSTNPFMDVPMNHWAYDAVSQLASRGVVSGYPDGAFKGEWKATRYEMASVVARALAYVDMNKASKEDLELLKRLVVEFKDELDALGVKVEDLDARVAVLESDIGGWALSGQFRFDAKWSDETDRGWFGTDLVERQVYTSTGDTDFTMSRYRLWITKRIDDKVKFIGRVGGNTLSWQRYYLEVTLPWDATMWVGLWNFDWEGADSLYNDNDALFTDQSVYGFYLTKNFSMGNFDLFVAHYEDSAYTIDDDMYLFGARLNMAFNEQFGGSLNYLNYSYDNAPFDTTVWWVAPYVNFTPDITLRGAYFQQSMDGVPWDSQSLWKAILDVKQEVTGFTSIWIEYVDVDRDFHAATASTYQSGQVFEGGLAQYDDFGSPMTPGLGEGFAAGNVIFVRLDQQWNDMWATFQRWGTSSLDTGLVDFDSTFWTFGVKYWYTPALSFELSYDNVSYGDSWIPEDNSMIRLRTFVSF